MDHHAEVMQLFDRFEMEFGQSLAGRIVEIMLQEIGGIQVRMPDLQDLYRKERNRRIRNMFTGDNHAELAIRFGITERQVRRILRR